MAAQSRVSHAARDRPTSVQRRTEVGELLRRLSSDLQEVGRDFGGRHEMNSSDVRALVLVLDAQRRGVDIGPSALATDLGMSAASITALVDRLESVGHLRREPDPHDRRRILLHVGDDAQRLGGQYFGGLQRRIDDATKEFSDRDLDAVARYLNAAISAVEDHMAQPGD